MGPLTQAHPTFESAVLGLIGISCVSLVLDSPLLYPGSALKLWLNRVDYGLTVCFIGESAAKIVAHGLLCEARGAYLKDPWNVADAVVVVASSISLWGGDENI